MIPWQKNSINILKIWEIIFGFRRSVGNFNNEETPERIGRHGPYVVLWSTAGWIQREMMWFGIGEFIIE